MKFKVQILHTLTETALISPDFQNLAWGHLCSIVAIFEITVKLPLGDFLKIGLCSGLSWSKKYLHRTLIHTNQQSRPTPLSWSLKFQWIDSKKDCLKNFTSSKPNLNWFIVTFNPQCGLNEIVKNDD